jgi:uncharacterized coiled-coil DUF342 family protein
MPISNDSKSAILQKIDQLESRRDSIIKRIKELSDKRDFLILQREDIKEKLLALKGDTLG